MTADSLPDPNKPDEKEKEKVNQLHRYVVLTESAFLLLEPEGKLSGISRLLSWATLSSFEQIKRNMDSPRICLIVFRKIDERVNEEVNFRLNGW
jgi:hypothetical protein